MQEVIERVSFPLIDACRKEGIPDDLINAVCHNTGETLGCSLTPVKVTIPALCHVCIHNDAERTSNGGTASVHVVDLEDGSCPILRIDLDEISIVIDDYALGIDLESTR